jgi:hypothetical protein
MMLMEKSEKTFESVDYECHTCGAILKGSEEYSKESFKCCSNPKLVMIAPPDLNEEMIEKNRLELVDCYEKIINAHKVYLDWNEDEIKLQTIWDISTYFYKEFPSFAYKYVTAMKSSGKSRLLKITATLAYNGKLTAGMSDSALFRSANDSTLIFDEAESINTKEKKSQRLILNAGYKRGASIQLAKEKRENGSKEFVIESYPVYCPKMLANITGMEDVLGSRCISSVMEKSMNPAKIKLMEDFDVNPYFLDIKRTLTRIQCRLCRLVYVKTAPQKWNSYIFDKYTPTQYTHTTHTTHTTLHTLTTLTTPNNNKIHDSILTQNDLDLFNLIDKYNLDGRNLELYFPLFIVAKLISDDVLKEILEIAHNKVKDKKQSDIMESKDVALYDFISKQPESRTVNYTPVKILAEEFRQFFENEDEIEWIKSNWMGKALNRLNLVTSKRRINKGMEVTLDINKAREQIKIFK